MTPSQIIADDSVARKLVKAATSQIKGTGRMRQTDAKEVQTVSAKPDGGTQKTPETESDEMSVAPFADPTIAEEPVIAIATSGNEPIVDSDLGKSPRKKKKIRKTGRRMPGGAE